MQAGQYSIALIGGNTIHCIDHLEVWEEVPAAFPEFETMVIDQYAPLDNKNVAWDKLQELQ